MGTLRLRTDATCHADTKSPTLQGPAPPDGGFKVFIGEHYNKELSEVHVGFVVRDTARNYFPMGYVSANANQVDGKTTTILQVSDKGHVVLAFGIQKVFAADDIDLHILGDTVSLTWNATDNLYEAAGETDFYERVRAGIGTAAFAFAKVP